MDESIRWDDLKVALCVAREGSLSRAGEVLGINHSTALRAVGRLESALGTRLFIRHQRGYQLTDGGRLLAERLGPVAGEIQRLCGTLATVETAPAGTLRISTVTDFSPFFAPLLHAFRREYPQIRVQIVATDDVLSLADGEVHVSVRIGQQPEEPDLIARRLMPVDLNFYAAQSYVDQCGLPESEAEFAKHQWVLPTGDKTRIPAIQELIQLVAPEQVAFQSNSFSDIESAVRAGMGIGPLSIVNLGTQGALEGGLRSAEGLVRVPFLSTSTPSQMWLVYHKDMRQSARVRALQGFLQRQLSDR